MFVQRKNKAEKIWLEWKKMLSLRRLPIIGGTNTVTYSIYIIQINTPMNMNQDVLNFDPHVSVDCVILGFDGESLQVLLSRRGNEVPEEQYSNLKLPGRLLHTDEDLDEAALDIITHITGKRHPLIKQFRAYGSPSRTSNPKDVLWLENAIKQKIGRIVTISYLSLMRITSRTLHRAEADAGSNGSDKAWYPVQDLPQLAFDHNIIIQDTLQELYRMAGQQPQMLFEMMPAKFTAAQLRRLHEQVSGKKIDVRNFAKLVMNKPYIIPLNEWEQNVSHRAARFYRFKQ